MIGAGDSSRPLLKALRSGNLFSKRDSAVLDAPEPSRGPALKRRAPVTEMPLRRDAAYANDYADGYDSDPEYAAQTRRPAVRVSFRGGLVPKTLWGRIAASVGLLVVAAVGVGSALWLRSFLLHDDHFVIPTSDAIQIAGNGHLTRAQLLSVFGEDVDRNIFNVPLVERRAELESLPWVAHATVMRFLPNRVRVAIVERTPVAFVRQGTQIGLVDVNGVLFDLPGPEMGDGKTAQIGPEYSFPVLSGISAADPLSTRAARMRIFLDFMAAVDATGENVSRRLSEVDVSNPEDVKAIIPDQGAAPADILVHFGEEKYLERYHQYEAHLTEWRATYPKLASVDMRYEQQVVLQMQPGAVTADAPTSGDAAPAALQAKPVAAKTVAAAKTKRPVAKVKGKAAVSAHMKASAMGAPVEGAR
jgi:cell division protein FtsQ